MHSPTKLVEYEVFFLRQLFRLQKRKNLGPVEVDMEYFDAQTTPKMSRHLTGYIDLNDWRPGFLAAGAPLIFVTCFKILDSIIEWALSKNINKVPFPFKKKIQLIDENIVKGTFEISPNNNWLDGYIVSLYKKLTPFRNALIHSGDFDVTTNRLNIHDKSHGGSITLVQLRALAELIVKITEILEGNNEISDEFHIKEIKFLLDKLTELHGGNHFGQRKLAFGKVRIHQVHDIHIVLDIEDIRKKIDPVMMLKDSSGRDHEYIANETLFDLEITLKEPDFGAEKIYIIPWDKVGEYLSGISFNELEGFSVP